MSGGNACQSFNGCRPLPRIGKFLETSNTTTHKTRSTPSLACDRCLSKISPESPSPPGLGCRPEEKSRLTCSWLAECFRLDLH